MIDNSNNQSPCLPILKTAMALSRAVAIVQIRTIKFTISQGPKQEVFFCGECL